MLHHTIRKTTKEEWEAQVPYLTSSMAESLVTCPRFGIIHNVLGKRMTTGYRQMALEAGSLMHEVFAALNLVQVGLDLKLLDHMHFHGKALFGNDRWDEMMRYWNEGGTVEFDGKRVQRLAIAVMSTSQFFDDPNDKNRTLSNLELCAYSLIQYWNYQLRKFRIHVDSVTDPQASIGVELSMDCIVDVYEGDENECDIRNMDRLNSFRTIGLADTVYQSSDPNINVSLGEFKTTASMTDTWRDQFDTRHQITLYNMMLNAYYARNIQEMDTILIGLSIPVRKNSLPVQHFHPATRTQMHVRDLLAAFTFSMFLRQSFVNNPLDAPMFTQSCFRYFRTCSMMDLCSAPDDIRQQMLDDMPKEPTLSPSEQRALLRNM